MKKFLVFLFLFGMVRIGFAASSEAINPEAEPVTIYGTAPVSGSINKMAATTRIRKITGNTQIYNGACRLYSLNIKSDTVGDLAAAYDDNADTPVAFDRLELEVGVMVANSSQQFKSNGAYFENGLKILLSDTTNSVVTVEYDY